MEGMSGRHSKVGARLRLGNIEDAGKHQQHHSSSDAHESSPSPARFGHPILPWSDRNVAFRGLRAYAPGDVRVKARRQITEKVPVGNLLPSS